MMRYRAYLSLAITFGLLALAGSNGSGAAADRNGSAGAVPEIRPAAAGPRRSFGFRRLLPNVSVIPSGFTRLDLGYPVADWFPVDLYGDGTWKLAVIMAGKSAYVGVFDPLSATWIDGPRAAPIWGGGWGVGDWNRDGYVEYAYIKADSIRYIDGRTNTDSLLWKLDYRPFDMTVWGRSPQGGPVVALQRSLATYPWGGPYQWRIYELFTGTLVKTLDGGGSALRVLHAYPGATTGHRLVLMSRTQGSIPHP